ncbi:AbiJ-NTD4 domain-containing protein [Thalassospira lohafexi]|uniref:HEPN AbiJ-N-terminal domain-containing protein n=1 Tax=Thalassospira lohafexi TaxID=744227 RepID=A0A2N3L1V5_9PROT|nr:hypothetical protein [Thalassospira lohafexi]PKR56690.1 hypothetical protein COO92_19985 [Thalassospira lohafexi]
MKSFAERYGYAEPPGMPIPERLKVETIHRLWSVLFIFKYTDQANNYRGMTVDFSNYATRLWFRFFKLPIDQIPRDGVGVVDFIRTRFYSYNWLKVILFIEFHLEEEDSSDSNNFQKLINAVLEEENEAYRIVDNMVICVTDQTELGSLEQALGHEDEFSNVSAHIGAALKLFSDRPKPDLRNAIKEAISAVESACKVVSGSPKATLGQALKQIPDLPGQMQEAFTKLYGYSSNANGIRHALMDDPKLTQAEAKFMIVACASFANYLIDSSRK